MAFRLQGRNIFLTYPQCSEDPADLLDWLLIKCPNAIKIRTCQEKHQDGNPHLHAIIKSSKKIDIKNANYFDYVGKHPSIEKVKDFRKAWNYIGKEGTDCIFEEENNDETDELDADDYSNEKEWINACIKQRMGYGYCKRLWELATKDQGTSIYETGDGIIREDLGAITRQDYCTVLLGPTGIGKTTWAKRECTKPALMISHIDDLRKFDKTFHKSIIFDDMTFKHMPLQAQIHITDVNDERSIHCRYGTATIPANTVKIFTCNENPFIEHETIERRICKITILK